jgi:hypothetical protein
VKIAHEQPLLGYRQEHGEDQIHALLVVQE